MRQYTRKSNSIAAARIAMVLLLATLASAVQAQPYVLGKLGYASADFALDAPYNGVVDDGAFTYGASAGLEFGRHFGVEAEWMGYGDFAGRATPCPIGQVCTEVVQAIDDNDINTLTVSLMPHTTIGRMDLFGRAGYYRARIEADTGFDGSDFTERGVVLGAGLRWDFEDKPWRLSIEASRMDDKIYRFTIGLGWQPEFGSE